ncbi:polysaccharide biosynthesis/export family protein [Aestuariibaculum sediminum]|uniref:Polysaccharide biosynthesis/export family protein n=1 Tax=Aestuariibaculum sediminum TaxID=2770637 RepID=A0A8J6Q356_9FLAO|nr:polysaccharide biosynthesis/export family protein [Aestuariibaculum sediminum]MBD0833081.1 polysaccharide biosynthesis/export family protein [Aestuariibaculum sediminum]
MLKPFFFLFCVVTLLCSSCITNKDIVYLQDKGHAAASDSLQILALSKPYRVQINDILSIDVKALDKELVEIFNPTSSNTTSGASEKSLYFNGFTVDLHGNIEFPILGQINVLGYTVEEIEDMVKSALLERYFKETAQIFVTVKLAGLKYTTLGEMKAGTHVIYQDRVNILEAIANAGDIRVTGDRRDVMIIRQYPQGQKIHHIDLTDINATKSEFYFIQPNDIILVKPLKRKALGGGQTAVQNLTTIVSVFSVLVSTYFIIRSL